MSTPKDASIESRLLRAVEVQPSDDALGWLDRRVAEVMAGARTPRHRRRRLRTFLRPLPLGAALLLVTGVVAGTLGLLERTATESGEGWRVAWEHAEVLAMSETDSGYTITLERAYADINQLVVFLDISGPLTGEAGGSVDIGASLIGPAGVPAMQIGTGAVEPDLAAVIRAWEAQASESGRYVLDVTALQIIPGGPFTEVPPAIEGTWRFEFELPELDGVTVNPDVSSTVDGVTVTLSEVRFSPSMIRGMMDVRTDDAATPVWPTLIFESVSHDGEVVSTDSNANFYSTPLGGDQANGVDFRTGFGTEVASGSWEFTISEIHFPEDLPNGRQGPWTLTFTVP